MALTTSQATGAIQWIFSKANTGFSATKQGADQLIGTVTYDSATINKGYGVTQTISVGSSQNFDLTALTDFVGDSVNMTKAVAFMITATGGACKVKAGATNGLSSWFVQDSGSLYIPAGGFALIGWPAAVGATVSGSAKVINIAQSGASAVTVTVMFIGG